ncbi:MAG: amino acid ABC transporter ATP-binding protein [Christensenellales bacterium]|jgi:polar amino acid transport system ATP-binding protein
MSIISATNIHKSFDSNHVLRGVELSVSKGEIVAVIGPSGSGKSTLLRCLIELERIDEGSILIEGEAFVQGGKYAAEKDCRRICSKMGMVFQQFNLFPHMSVKQNLISAPIIVAEKSMEEAEALCASLLRKVGLEDKLNAMPQSLSGGQKQRAAIARALMMQPDIMLFDEPTSSLDPELTGEVLNTMKALTQEHITMLVVTHEIAFAREVADRVIFMDDGVVVADGAPEQVLENPDNPRLQAFLCKVL